MICDPVTRLEHQISEYIGREYCICTWSGTSGLILGLRALNLPPSSEVILPSFCCEAIPRAVRLAGLTPLFCDVSVKDYNLDLTSVKNVLSRRTRVIIAVHLFGYPCQMGELLTFARERSLIVLEDAAQALGGNLDGRRLGSFGEVSVVSFGFRKIIDVGGGGAILTDDYSLAREIRDHQLRYECFSMAKAKGYNMLDQLQAVWHFFEHSRRRKMLPEWAERMISGIGMLEDIVAIRRRNMMIYRDTILSSHFSHPEYQSTDWACFRYSVLLNTVSGARARAELKKSGVWSTNLYPSTHRNYFRKSTPANRLPNTDVIASKILNLMVAETFPEAEIRRMAQIVNNVNFGV